MKVEIICKDNKLKDILGIETTSYEKAVELAFQKIEQNLVLSSWKDSLITSSADKSLNEFVEVPKFGIFTDSKEIEITGEPERVLSNVWSIGGARGWYYANFLWKVRGFIDKLVGGVGLRRGRTNTNKISAGDALDFWRVLVADKENRRLLLHAEMKLPGDAWLEFRIISKSDKNILQQTATFRPSGLLGRLYWYFVKPFHFFVFEGMAKNIEKYGKD
jgi:hypothetical protein